MYKRYDLYGPVHKGLRLALSGICYQVGSADVTDQQKVESFIEEWRRIVITLEAHSHDEDLHLNDVYMKYAPETAKQLEEEHVVLDRQVHEINELVSDLENTASMEERSRIWYQIGRRLNSFTAEYFIHLQREEGPGMEALCNNLDDDQIHELSVKIRSSIQPHAMMIFLHYMLPSITHADRFVMLSDMKRFAPQEFYEAVLSLAESRLEPQSLSRLKSELDNDVTGAVS
ncbi:hemerythrin domain-containing protein [Brevibacillus ginsengisoli]|uniref:hemerythrin domain-containing protein n=1 Tax=Brevibacillus ginsengisoli TaxID=363854 RepID=UPI003CE88D5E